MAFTASTFHLSLAGFAENSSDADRTSSYTDDHDVFICFGVCTNPRREHANVPLKATSSGICDPSRVRPSPCPPVLDSGSHLRVP